MSFLNFDISQSLSSKTFFRTFPLFLEFFQKFITFFWTLLFLNNKHIRNVHKIIYKMIDLKSYQTHFLIFRIFF